MFGDQDQGQTGHLRTRELAAAFRDTSSSYKFYWFLAIIDLLDDFDDPVPVRRIVQAMIVRAWAAVLVYRLSLGKIDRLQQCVLEFQAHANLAGRSSPAKIERALEHWPGIAQWTEELARFVPGRFLGAWFSGLHLRAYDRRGAQDVALAASAAFGTAASAPYRLLEHNGATHTELAPGWRDWLRSHRPLVTGFVELHLVHYLQARNPNVPAISEKLVVPQRRSLALARGHWRGLLAQSGMTCRLDIYTALPLADDFEVDHFLPWSFVAHDEFWNLCPVNPGINRSKSDRLPDLDVYLPRLIALHLDVLRQPNLPPALASAYSVFLGVAPDELGGVPDACVEGRYAEVIRPLAQIAANQGFPSGWLHTAATLRARPPDMNGAMRR